ncbi:unnamed protein product [Didymodactylos carnosus]|uniref:Uncharacterized protein n=1 Tax=Didymodactylos carnosus TaxID=1234261 RepID=A0A815ZQ36_9BILA|nr:unnamed protein product [Didymodactylos carnosus]CAF4457263.1 unnamed protein product [Didymodactylos carnosus]
MDNHFPPTKIVCTPKLQKEDGAGFVKSLVKYIEKHFNVQNPFFKKPLGFEAWWVDMSGDVSLLTKCSEMFFYLCIQSHYPAHINDVQLEPQLPKKLSSPFSVLIKFVNNDVSIQDIKNQMDEKYESIYSCHDLMGTNTSRARHIRIDFTDRNDYDSILNGGQVSLFSQLYDVKEFLEAPKLLIWY